LQKGCQATTSVTSGLQTFRASPGILTLLFLSVLAVSASLTLPPVTATGSGITINSWHPELTIGGVSGQRLLNVTVDIANLGTVAQNFTIKLLWDGATVASLNVTSFSPGARQSFTLFQSIAFDPTTGHIVGVSAGDASVFLPAYRPPGYAAGSSDLPWWIGNTGIVIVLVVAIAISTALIVLTISRRLKAPPSVSLATQSI
jgi:hypothetical protein